MHKIKKLEDIINFQDNQINKKILAKSNEHIAMLVAIKENQLMEEHISPIDAFIYVAKGEIEFEIKENQNNDEPKVFKLKKDDIFFFKANEKHSLLGIKNSIILIVKI